MIRGECLRCNNEIISNKATRTQNFCSQECKWRHRFENKEKKHRSRSCKNCSVEFSDSSSTNQLKYCDQTCRYLDGFRRKYGLNRIEYFKLKEKFPNCGICASQNSFDSELSIDHCHITGKIRGMLCQKCNQALGGFQDNSELLQRAITYLKETS